MLIRLFPLLVFSSFAFGSGQSIDLLYRGGNFEFANVQLQITPYNKGIFYDSTAGKRYSMDCNDTDKPGVWRCIDPCGTGPIKIHFSKKTGFEKFQIKSLNITPRKCDGKASALDKPVKIKTPMTFKLLRVEKEYKHVKKK